METINLPLRNRHAVHYEKQPENIFYIYHNEKWNKCKNVDSLPYSLVIFSLIDDETEVVTCLDSYRLVTESQYKLGYIPTKEELEYESKWRNELKEKDELDFFYKDQWLKVEIAWKKSDIVPSVLNIIKRKNKMGWIGYFYYESKKFAKSCTYTQKFTKEELEKEERLENEAIKRNKENKIKINNIKNTLKVFKPKPCCEDYKYALEKYKIRDVLEYYSRLNIIPRLEEPDIVENIKDKYFGLCEFNKTLFSILIKKTDGCISKEFECEKVSINNTIIFLLKQFDGYIDFYLKLNDVPYTKIEKSYIKLSNYKIEGVYNEEKNIIEFKDFNISNPIISHSTKYIEVILKEDLYLNNIQCFCKGIVLDSFPKTFLSRNIFYNYYVKSEKSYFFVDGFESGFKISEDDLELVEEEYIDEEVKQNYQIVGC